MIHKTPFPGRLRRQFTILSGFVSVALLLSLSSCDWFLSFPKEGSRAPISHNPVLEVGERFGDICTMNVPDHLHRESFSHAIYHHRPDRPCPLPPRSV